MVLNQEANVCRDTEFDGRCLMGECLDEQRNNLVDSDDSKSDEGCEDIADLLPNDPFEMEFNIALPNDPFGMDFNISLPRDPFGMEFDFEATFAAFTGWLEDFSLRACGFETDEGSEDNKNNNDDNTFFAELNFIWTSSMKYEMGENEVSYDEQTMFGGGDVEDFMCFGCEKYQNDREKKDGDDAGVGAPADALFFALGYLGVKELLSIERVCKPLCDAVQNDPLIWRNIHIDNPLSNTITDDDLLRLTNRAQGRLCSLSLVKCLKITTAGLKCVLESNQGLTKLSVPGCSKLSVESIMHNLKAFNSVCLPGIKRLRLGEVSSLTNDLLKEFKLLLGADGENKNSTNYKPRYYGSGQLYLSLEDERAIDVETCPRCQLVRQIYDCPSESCQLQNNSHSTKTCRACSFCIARCVNCGCCLDNKAYEETFCLKLLCLDCMTELFNCQDTVALSPRHTYVHQMASYRFVVFRKKFEVHGMRQNPIETLLSGPNESGAVEADNTGPASNPALLGLVEQQRVIRQCWGWSSNRSNDDDDVGPASTSGIVDRSCYSISARTRID